MALGFVGGVRLTAYGLGALGAALLFFEFFQLPTYVDYDEDFGNYSIDLSPPEVTEHTWIGRVGALLLSLSFALLFVATFLE